VTRPQASAATRASPAAADASAADRNGRARRMLDGLEAGAAAAAMTLRVRGEQLLPRRLQVEGVEGGS